MEMKDIISINTLTKRVENLELSLQFQSKLIKSLSNSVANHRALIDLICNNNLSEDESGDNLPRDIHLKGKGGVFASTSTEGKDGKKP